MSKLRYSEFVDSIDVDAFEAAIGFTPDYQKGDEDTGFCPDWDNHHSHGDTTGKFSINRDKKVYNCWVAGGGSLLSLTMEIFGYEIDEATEWLYQFSHGDHRTDEEFLDYFNSLLVDGEKRTVTLPFFNERVLDRFDEETDWFESRGISNEIILSKNLRYSSAAMKSAPRKGGEKIDDDYFGPSIILPHYWKGRLVGWQHRWLEEDRPRWVAKYTNTTDFPKTETLFNFDSALRAEDPILVVESVPTCLFLESLGFDSVATFGANVSDVQMRLLRRFQAGVYLCPDNDSAGIGWLDDLTEYLESYIPVYIVPVIDRGQGSDLGDLAQDEDPLESVVEVLANSVNSYNISF